MWQYVASSTGVYISNRGDVKSRLSWRICSCARLLSYSTSSSTTDMGASFCYSTSLCGSVRERGLSLFTSPILSYLDIRKLLRNRFSPLRLCVCVYVIKRTKEESPCICVCLCIARSAHIYHQRMFGRSLSFFWLFRCSFTYLVVFFSLSALLILLISRGACNPAGAQDGRWLGGHYLHSAGRHAPR